MITQSDGSILYTQEERQSLIDQFDEKILGLTTDFNKVSTELWNANATITSLRNLDSTADIADKILEVFRNEVREGNMDSDNATELYNKIADALGLRNVSSITRLWSVSVAYYDDIVAEFSDVEAISEEDAIESVRQDMEVESAEVHFTISFNGDTCEESSTLDVSYYDFEISASEQF